MDKTEFNPNATSLMDTYEALKFIKTKEQAKKWWDGFYNHTIATMGDKLSANKDSRFGSIAEKLKFSIQVFIELFPGDEISDARKDELNMLFDLDQSRLEQAKNAAMEFMIHSLHEAARKSDKK